MAIVIRVSGGHIGYSDGVLYSEGLKESCPYCSSETCYADCDGSQGDVDGLESEEQMVERRVSNAAIDGVESLVLAMLSSGVIGPVWSDVDGESALDSRVVQAIEVALDAVGNNT